jgi:hypothetical protein
MLCVIAANIGCASFRRIDDRQPDVHLIHLTSFVEWMSFQNRIYEDFNISADASAKSRERINYMFAFSFGRRSNLCDQIDTARSHMESIERQRSNVREMFGSSKADEIAEYERTIDARYEVEDLRLELKSAGIDITDEQRRALIAIAIRQGAFVAPREVSASESDLALRREIVEAMRQRDSKMEVHAGELLTAAQARRAHGYFIARIRSLNLELGQFAEHPEIRCNSRRNFSERSSVQSDLYWRARGA